MTDLLRVARLQAVANDIDAAASTLETALAIAQTYDPHRERWDEWIGLIDGIRLLAKVRMDEIVSAEISRREL